MPCNSDYLEPTSRERELQRAAKLLCFVCQRLDNQPPAWAVTEAANIYARDARTVPALCAILQGLRPETRDAIVYDPSDPASRDLANWWEAHLAADAAREQKEAKAKADRITRDKAMAKLTAAEREVLGL